MGIPRFWVDTTGGCRTATEFTIEQVQRTTLYSSCRALPYTVYNQTPSSSSLCLIAHSLTKPRVKPFNLYGFLDGPKDYLVCSRFYGKQFDSMNGRRLQIPKLEPEIEGNSNLLQLINSALVHQIGYLRNSLLSE